MKIEVGKYIRTRKGISKILEINDDICIVDKNGTLHNDYSFNEYVKKEDILKISDSIIDLIVVGDYVNGCYVERTKYTYENKNFIDFEPEINAGSGYGFMLSEDDIKSVITKEQMESIAYKVEK